MDTIASMRAFVAVASTGSFTQAARMLDLVPSVVTRRVMQLERMLGRPLLQRSTRKVVLNAAGEHHLSRFKTALAAHDDAIAQAKQGVERLSGPLVIKVPATLGHLRLNDLIHEFAAAHADVSIEIIAADGPVDPAAAGIDIAITAFTDSFNGVVDEFLWPIKRGVYASPGYLADGPELSHPSHLPAHRCLAYRPGGLTWSFRDKRGPVSITIKPRLCSNDMMLLLRATQSGLGVALLSDYVAAAAVASGDIVRVLDTFTIPDLWIKAAIPADRRSLPKVSALLAHIARAAALHADPITP